MRQFRIPSGYTSHWRRGEASLSGLTRRSSRLASLAAHLRTRQVNGTFEHTLDPESG
jgi:hypothetical protein